MRSPRAIPPIYLIDRNGDHQISFDEWKPCFEKCFEDKRCSDDYPDQGLSDTDIQNIINEVDKDGDGLISPDGEVRGNEKWEDLFWLSGSYC